MPDACADHSSYRDIAMFQVAAFARTRIAASPLANAATSGAETSDKI